jgi:hypothetical protein
MLGANENKGLLRNSCPILGPLVRSWESPRGVLTNARREGHNRGMNTLEQRRVVVGVSGGIAAYKTCELVRELRRQGAIVTVAMTPAAKQFVAPLTFSTLSGRPVLDDVWAMSATGGVVHVHVGFHCRRCNQRLGVGEPLSGAARAGNGNQHVAGTADPTQRRRALELGALSQHWARKRRIGQRCARRGPHE